jgi:large repetitive protein
MHARCVRRSGLHALLDATRIEMLESRQLLAAPDLTAAIVSLDSVVARGHQITVDFRITNSGNAPTDQNWADRIWLSPTSTFDSKTATQIGWWWNSDVATLPLAPTPGPGNSYEISRSAGTSATLTTGTWYVFVETDLWNGVAESNETNNFSPAASITVIAPDIAMSAASITNLPNPYNVTWGQTIDVSFTVTNKTAARLDGYWYDAVVASKDSKLDPYPTDWALNYIAYEPMAAHGSYTHTTQVKIDGPWALSAGPGYLLFVANNVDWSSPDADRSDNVIAIPITVRAPDLQVTTSGLDDKGITITPASLVPTGTSVNVSWTVTNTGDANAVTPWSDSVYISKTNTYDNAAQWLGYSDPPPGTFPLVPAGTYTRNFAIDTTGYDGGQYYVFARADSNGALQETSDANNVSAAMPLHLVAPATTPDLTIDNLSITPNTGNIGTDTLTVSYQVHNIDPVNPTTNSWYDIFWLSRTPTFDRATAIWANTLYDNPGVLGPGGTYSYSATFPFPTNVGLGTFYVFVEADANNWYQQESNGNNNLTTQNDVTLALHGADFTTTTATIDNGSGDPNNSDITVGSPFTVNWHVDNTGDSDTPADWIDAIYVTDLWYVDQTAMKIGEFSAQSLGLTTPIAAGGSYDASGIVAIPAWLGTGNKNIFVVSGLQSTGGGDGNSIQYQPDPNIYNNTYGAVQVQLRQADLALASAIAYVSSAKVGDLVKVDWSVANNGDAGVPAGWVDRIYISSFPTFSEQTARPLYTFTTNFSMGGQGSSYGTGVDIDTSGLDGGAYYLFVVTDADHTVAETNESNNVSAAVPLTLVAAPGLPDLTASIDSVLPDPAVGNIGVSSIDVTYTIHNIAPDPTDGGGWSDRIWLSSTPAFNPATAISLGTFWNDAPTLPSGGSYTSTATVFLPAGVGIGTFYLFVQADIDNNQLESNGSNNLSLAAGAAPVELNGPDLVVTSTSFNNYNWDPNSRQVTLNSLFELGWTIENQGNADSSSAWADAIYVSDSPIWDPSSARLVTQFNAPDPLPLGPSAFYEVANQLSLPGWVGAGLHFLFVVTGVQPGAGNSPIIFEPDANFASNVSVPIRINVIVPVVDLTVAIDNAPLSVTPGQYVTTPVDWTVSNNGYETANGNTNLSYNWTDTLYLTQTPDDRGSYVLLASYDTAYTGNTPLWGNSSYAASISGIDIPYGIAPGAWYFVIVTDANNDQGETNESNNVATIPVQIGYADLTTPAISVTPAAVPIGQTLLHVTWTVHNGGDADAAGGWFDVIYVSWSPVFDNTAVQLTWLYHPDVLLQGQDYTVSTDVTLSASGAGPLYIYVVADGFNFLPETNEDNNASTGFAIDLEGGSPRVISGADATDTLYLRRSIGGTAIEAFSNSPTSGAPTWVFGLIASITFNGFGSSDTLTLDFSNGSPIPTGGITFAGGDGSDELILASLAPGQNLQVQPTQVLVGTMAVASTGVEATVLDASAGSVVQLNSLTLTAPLAMAAGKGLVLRANALAITSGGSLDLADGKMILDYAGPTPAQVVRGLVRNGQTSGTPSIRSTALASTKTLAMIDNALVHMASFAGQALPSPFSQILIGPALRGDANFDGKVDDRDMLAVFTNMGRTGGQWLLGDLDQDGNVDLDDYTQVQANLGEGLAMTGTNLLAAPVKPAAPAKSATVVSAAKSAPAATAKSVAKKVIKAKVQKPKALKKVKRT